MTRFVSPSFKNQRNIYVYIFRPISPYEKSWVAGANHILRLHAVSSIDDLTLTSLKNTKVPCSLLLGKFSVLELAARLSTQEALYYRDGNIDQFTASSNTQISG